MVIDSSAAFFSMFENAAGQGNCIQRLNTHGRGTGGAG